MLKLTSFLRQSHGQFRHFLDSGGPLSRVHLLPICHHNSVPLQLCNPRIHYLHTGSIKCFTAGGDVTEESKSCKDVENACVNSENSLVKSEEYVDAENVLRPEVQILEYNASNNKRPLPQRLAEVDGGIYYKGVYMKDVKITEKVRKEDFPDTSDDAKLTMDGFNLDLTCTKAILSKQQPLDIINLPALRKDFFTPTSHLMERSAEENSRYLKKNQIQVLSEILPPAIQQFSDYNFPEAFSPLLEQFDAPTAIQAQGWSTALQGRDLVGISETGSGKTLGYLLPGLIHISHQQAMLRETGQSQNHAPVGIVLVPTTELAQQIIKVAEEYGPKLGVETVDLIGGSNPRRQLAQLKNSKLVIGTPGRVLDLLYKGHLQLRQCSFLVLDEADRMLDLGFEPQIKEVMRHTRPDRQTLMWSATWPDEIQDLAFEFMNHPVKLCVGSTKLRANPNITQHIHVCTLYDKSELLYALLAEMLHANKDHKALVFAETEERVQKIVKSLRKQDIAVDALYGTKCHDQREFTLKCFRSGYFSVLVATDIAARGLDIPDLCSVFNFDYPSKTRDYVHRIGRTGRAGKRGVAHTFFTADNKSLAPELIDVLRRTGQPITSKLQYLAREAPNEAPKTFFPVVDRFGQKVRIHRTVEGSMSDLHRRLSEPETEKSKFFMMYVHQHLKKKNKELRDSQKKTVKGYRISKEKMEYKTHLKKYIECSE